MNDLAKWIVGISAGLVTLAVVAGLGVWRSQSVLERDVTINTTNIAQNTVLIKELKDNQAEAMTEIRAMFRRIENQTRVK